MIDKRKLKHGIIAKGVPRRTENPWLLHVRGSYHLESDRKDGIWDKFHLVEARYKYSVLEFPLEIIRNHPDVIQIDMDLLGYGTPDGKEGTMHQGDLHFARWEKRHGKWYEVRLSCCSYIPNEVTPEPRLDSP